MCEPKRERAVRFPRSGNAVLLWEELVLGVTWDARERRFERGGVTLIRSMRLRKEIPFCGIWGKGKE